VTFAAPLALGIAVAAAIGVVLWHLIAAQRPEPAPLPTARFVPEGETRAATRRARPTDLLLLALRVLALLLIGAAFAGPTRSAQRAGHIRVFVADASRAADRAVHDSVLAQWRAGDAVIWFDSAATAAADSVGDRGPGAARGRLSAGLVRAYQRGAALRERTDSLELVVVSPFEAEATDAAVRPLLARWPGRVRLVRTPMRRTESSMVRTVTTPPSATDSAAARQGATIVWWPSAGRTPAAADGVWAGAITVVAPLARLPLTHEGTTVARWSDGAPAASEREVGAGCLRRVSIGVPTLGDLVLQPGFRALDARLHQPCNARSAGLPDSTLSRWSHDWGAATAAHAPLPGRSALTMLLLLLGALALVAELVLRRRDEVVA
jgi:hypothetical protein